ncbi:MAG: hypothetical protein CMO13_03460 [Thaumarchaeota archaeon]|nr:hypothetical protein [Nitrososphaerota archaeon]
MQIKKSQTLGIVLAAGSGTRLHPLTKSISKALIPIAGVPIIEYSLSALTKIGIKNFNIVCQKSKDFEYLLNVKKFHNHNIEITSIKKPIGIRKTILAVTKNNNFKHYLICHADNVYSSFPNKLLQVSTFAGLTFEKFQKNNINARIQNGKVIDFLTKPNATISGVYVFSREAIMYIKSNNKIFDSWGITSGLQQALVDKNVIAGLRFTKKIINVNTLQDLICANSYVLKNITKQKNFIDKNSKIDVNAKIGPNVSIGKNSVINAQTSISNSIIMNDVIVKRGASIKNSVIYNRNIVTQNSNIINQIII